MIEIGRLCVKIAGREAGRKCVVVDVVDNNYVLIDGQLRRKKCNISHLEPLDKKIELKKNASHSDVVSKFKKLKMDIKEISKQSFESLSDKSDKTKKKEKKERPRKQRGKKKAKAEEKPEEKVKKKKTAKKEKKAEKKKDIEAKLEK